MRSSLSLFYAIAVCFAPPGAWADDEILNLCAVAPPLAVSG